MPNEGEALGVIKKFSDVSDARDCLEEHALLTSSFNHSLSYNYTQTRNHLTHHQSGNEPKDVWTSA